MASKRRGGFRPPELRGTLGTLLRTTTGVVRDALERGASAGRARLDDVRSSRRRTDALAELGELVLDLIRRGEIDLAELPEARDLVRHLDDLDAADDEPDEPRAAVRRRFDDREPAASPIGRPGNPGRRADVWRPYANEARDADEREEASHHADDGDERSGRHTRSARDERSNRHAHDDRPARPSSAPRPSFPSPASEDDGTVSSGAAFRASRPTTPARPRPPETESSRAPTKPMKGPWRRPDPVLADEPEPILEAPSRPHRPMFPPDPHRRGGISFDDDDLNEYMHPDDVPSKGPPRDPDASDS